MWSLFKIFLILVACRELQAYSKDECLLQDNCQSCLLSHVDCAWCTDKIYENYRCGTPIELKEQGCPDDRIYKNDPKMDIVEDIGVKDFENVDDFPTQIKPQRISLKLVKAQSERIKLTYRPARNHPLDLYILMDLTWSMRDDRETLVELGTELTKTLGNLTGNYRIGFGSYADKPKMPMAMPNKQENPCAGEYAICAPTYSYHHHISLTDNLEEFIRSVKNSRITGNLDNLEGGLEALMQVLVCPQQIGWNPKARKIVILVTDGYMHFAGDGLLAGIVRPNDKKCHLSDEGEYTGALEYDYPSLEEIYRELVKRKISVIFAVTSQVVNTYKQMSELMKDISKVDILQADSSNILEVIRNSYLEFTKSTQFSDNSPPYIRLDYETDCGGQFDSLRKRNYCSDVQMGQEIDFYINITLTDFPEDGNYTHKIRVEESGISEFLQIDVEIQEACPCHEPIDEWSREKCSDNGDMQCGMCRCEEGWIGLTCNCNPSNATTSEAMWKMCRPVEESSLGPVCSNRGECYCGMCACYYGFSGKYCECNQECDIGCNLKRAECVCGECVCDDGWTGPDCNCKESNEDCKGPNGDVCSSRGQCECGKCNCDEQNRGNFCEIGIENSLCVYYKPCATCLIKQKIGTGYCENISEVCLSQTLTHVFVQEIKDVDVRCLVRLENREGIKMDHYFSYAYLPATRDNYLIIQATNYEPVNYASVGLTIVGLTILLGLLIVLCFKLCCWYSDRQEYLRFEQNSHEPILMESPIYKNPVRKYSLPHKKINFNDNPFLEGEEEEM